MTDRQHPTSPAPTAPAPVVAHRSNPVAITSLTCGMLGLFLLPIVFSIAAVVCGAVGLHLAAEPGRTGRAAAGWGLGLGILGTVVAMVQLMPYIT